MLPEMTLEKASDHFSFQERQTIKALVKNMEKRREKEMAQAASAVNVTDGTNTNWITVTEAAEYLGTVTTNIYSKIQKGFFKTRQKEGSPMLVSKSSLDTYKQEREAREKDREAKKQLEKKTDNKAVASKKTFPMKECTKCSNPTNARWIKDGICYTCQKKSASNTIEKDLKAVLDRAGSDVITAKVAEKIKASPQRDLLINAFITSLDAQAAALQAQSAMLKAMLSFQ